MNSRAPQLALLALGMLLGPARASAQCTYCSIPLLQFPAGARPLGLGGAYVAGDGPDAVFYNPAQVGTARGSTVNMARVGGTTIGEFATTGRAGAFGLGAGVRFTSRAMSTSMEDDVGEGALVAGVAAATEVHGVSLGGSANFVTDNLAGSVGGAVFNAGAAARAFGLRIGVSVRNLGADQGTMRLPTTASLGAMLPPVSLGTYFDLAATAEIERERGGALVPRGGVELVYEPVSGWTVTGRLGARRSLADPGRLPQGGLVVGASLGIDAISLDYAFSPAAAGGRATHSLGLRIQ